MSLNPALPLLALLGAAGLLAGHGTTGLRRGLATAWAVLSLAGIALLAPVLALPTGIPSPAAVLAAVPPWQGTGDPAQGNPVLRDVTFQIQPWQLFLRSELRAGRLPLWNPHQFAGAPFWSNGQSAPLFPLHLLFAALPLQLGFILLPWLRLMIGGCGAWLLARELDLGRGALLTALIYPLSGMLVSFLLFPMGNALALVPWVLWSVERIATGARGGWIALAAAGGLQLLAGHPETAAHTALLSALWLLVRGGDQPLGAWLRLAGGWLAAAALAAVQILPLALLLPETSRWLSPRGGEEPPFLLLLLQPLRLVLPRMYGASAAGTWWGPFNDSATAVYAGALALPLAAAGLALCRTDRRWRAVVAVVAFSFLAAYHWPGVRDVMNALPLLGRAPHHRLIFGVELGLALLAGAGLDRWLERRGRGVMAGAGLAVLLLAAGWVTFAGEWSRRGLTAGQLGWTAASAGAAALLVLSLRWRPERRRAVWLVLPVFAACDLLAANGGVNPALPLERLYPETGAVRFLRGRQERVAGLGDALRPNAALVYGLFDPRGDDPVKLERFEAVYRTFAPGDPVYFQPVAQWGAPWLDRLGVRWVVAAPDEAAADPTWRLAWQGDDARVWERPTALPLVRWDGGSGGALRVTREPGRWRIAWSAPAPGLLVVAETWDRGWSARSGGRPAAVEAVDGALLGVRLGPGSGRLDLRYRPAGLAAGAVLSGLALIGLAGACLARAPHPPAPLSHPLPPTGRGGCLPSPGGWEGMGEGPGVRGGARFRDTHA